MPKKKKLFLFRKIKRILEGFLKLGFCMESVPFFMPYEIDQTTQTPVANAAAFNN